jgi:hypothetical protein
MSMADTIGVTFRDRSELALSYGIAVMPVEPGGKNPACEHGAKDATKDQTQIDLWDDKDPRFNVGWVATPELGGRYFVDSDIENLPALYKSETGRDWPTTLTNKSAKGFHYVYEHDERSLAKFSDQSGKPKNFSVSDPNGGELFSVRVHNYYVVGALSVHPSGAKYEIVEDRQPTAAPPEFIDWLISKRASTSQSATVASGERGLIPHGSIHGWMLSRAGELRNKGLNQEEIEPILLRLVHENCEPPIDNKKVVAMAKSIGKYPPGSDYAVLLGGVVPGTPKVPSNNAAASSASVYVVESPARVISDDDYRAPAECLEGDLLCDLTHELTDGTFIPPQFVHGDLQVFAGHLLDGRVVPPNSSYLSFSTRFYLNKFSVHPETGKGVSWERVKWAFADLFPGRPRESLVEQGQQYFPRIVNGVEWGSGPFMVSQLAETPNCICWLDEGSVHWLAKAESDQKSIESAFLSLFDGNDHGTGSFKNKKHHASNVHLSLTASFTLDSFTSSYQGRQSSGSGYLSRVLLAFGSKIPTKGDWPILDNTRAKKVASDIAARLANLPQLTIEPEAQKLASDFKLSLQKEDQHFTSRIGYYFDKDRLLRAFFRDGVVTADLVRRSIRWAQEQIELRKRFWPPDSLNEQGLLEFRILSEFETAETLRSDRQLKKSIHLGERRCKFSAQQYNWALGALLKSGELERAGYNRTGHPVYKRQSQ